MPGYQIRETRHAIGGHVYRGDAIPQLEGAYVFMDMTGPVWAMGWRWPSAPRRE